MKYSRKQLQCPDCSRGFKAGQGLAAHMRTAHNRSDYKQVIAKRSAGTGLAEAVANGESHLKLAIAEIEAKIDANERQAHLLHNALDGLLAAEGVLRAIVNATQS